jgi:hypothetical protein
MTGFILILISKGFKSILGILRWILKKEFDRRRKKGERMKKE